VPSNVKVTGTLRQGTARCTIYNGAVRSLAAMCPRRPTCYAASLKPHFHTVLPLRTAGTMIVQDLEEPVKDRRPHTSPCGREFRCDLRTVRRMTRVKPPRQDGSSFLVTKTRTG